MNRLSRRIVNLVQGQEGTNLIEVLLGLAIMGTIGITLLGALSTSIICTRIVDEQNIAQVAAQAQLEDTKQAAYLVAPATYPITITPPEGYSVSAEAQPLPDADDDIQKIEITVYRHGRGLLTLEDYKVNR